MYTATRFAGVYSAQKRHPVGATLVVVRARVARKAASAGNPSHCNRALPHETGRHKGVPYGGLERQEERQPDRYILLNERPVGFVMARTLCL